MNKDLALKAKTDYENCNMSIPDISEKYKISKSTVRRRLLNLGTRIRSQSEGVRLAIYKIVAKTTGKKRKFTKLHCKKISEGRKAFFSSEPLTKRLNKKGYFEFTRGELQGILEHRYVAEKYIIKRKLKPFEEVHHINGDRSDNRVSNLQVMTKSEHAALHAKERYTKRIRNKYGRFV